MNKSKDENISGIGPGKYDDLCTLVREGAKAGAVVVIIIDGEHGFGFSVQATAGFTYKLPDILDTLAKDIRGLVNDIPKH
jgi:hypothetical protein